MSFQFGRFRLGLRTIKTAVAILIILVFTHLFHRGQSAAMIAGISAIIAVRDSYTATVHASKARFIGSALGGLLAIVYDFFYLLSHQNFSVQIILIPLMVLINIVIMDGFKLHPGLVGANATFLIIALTIPENAYVSYALNRVFDTFFGVAVATLVNSAFIHDAPKLKIKKVIRDRLKRRQTANKTTKKEQTK
ncbi:FUSC family protein [Pseudolactococcus reticulitermitis]|uniref:Uncharacterized protein n=1 Tax=Pseudolactococcus reticulitermitis TaxID=2025039 RepID=A0A224X434_9LACT|nr:aromatic acid exporter family protein [Lactococcus reticulitermitis]GAX47466.1 hypothetical protein RsY01_1066 [Lactococcus reticulitermitis]GHU39731.1 FUSC family protein [Bacilli bacterium]